MSPGRRAILTILKVSDLGVVTFSFVIAIAATARTHPAGNWFAILEMRIALLNVLFVIGYVAVWHFVLRGCGLYHSYRLSAASRELRDLSTAILVATLPLLPLGPLFQFQYVNPAFLVVFATIAFLGLGVERRILRAIGRRIRCYGRNLRNVVVVGTGDATLELTSRLARRNDFGYHVVAVIESNDRTNVRSVLDRVDTLIEQSPIDEVFVALPLDASPVVIRGLLALCEEQGITVRVATQVASLYWARALVDEIEGQPVVTVYTGPPDSPRLLAKRAIDLLGGVMLFVLCAPLFLLVGIAIVLDSPGSVFFAQERVGYNRRRFYAYKFRTMVREAERMQGALEPLNEATGPVFKIQNDPRVTRIGKWLRRTSIDELPQLINVLKGEMSLVGPRPLPVRDVDRIDVRWHKRRFSVKPGITCLWQINSREPEFDEWIRLDMEYIDNWSLALDLKILARTIPAVLSGQGVH